AMSIATSTVAAGVESKMVMVGLSGMGCEHSHSRETLTGHGRLDRCAPAAKSCAHRRLCCRRPFIPQVLWQRVHLERHTGMGRPGARRMALHRAGQADAKWV